MFEGAASFNQPIQGWVINSFNFFNMPSMFEDATAWLLKYERIKPNTTNAPNDEFDGPPSAWQLKDQITIGQRKDPITNRI